MPRMPIVEITSVTASHIWDDETKSDFVITKGNFDDTGYYVELKDGNDTVYLRPESWPLIRDQINAMMECGLNL